MKKSVINLLTVGLLSVTLLGCSSKETEKTPQISVDFPVPVIPLGPTADNSNLSEHPVELRVVTSYGSGDGNQQYYESAYLSFEAATGHKIIDDSNSSSEEWKKQVQLDFETGNDPDVLFFYTEADADSLVANDKVVSLEEIRSVYPQYGNNMLDEMLPNSSYNGEKYVIPVNGYWEGLFVNKVVVEKAGVSIPDSSYTWEQFLADCEKIKQAGFTPISVSIASEPHYWFEFSILNHGTVDNHLEIPKTVHDDAIKKWTNALEDIKFLYDMGYFPENTLESTGTDALNLMANDQAAFLIDGNWRIIWFHDYANENNFTTTYVPAKGERLATEMIRGISMGYYISRSAWEDPYRQVAAVDFVTAMTTSEIVSNFGVTNLTAMKNTVIIPEGLSQLELDSVKMKNAATGGTNAVQDILSPDQRGALFAGLIPFMKGETTAEQLIIEALNLA